MVTIYLMVVVFFLCHVNGDYEDCTSPDIKCNETEVASCGMQTNFAEVDLVERSATPHDAPWLVTISTSNNKSCSGALIENQWILTSVSCAKVAQKITPLADLLRKNGRTYEVDTKVDHPNGTEISLIKLKTNVTVDLFVFPVCVTRHDDEDFGRGAIVTFFNKDGKAMIANADSFMDGTEGDPCHVHEGEWKTYKEICTDVSSCDAIQDGHPLLRPFRKWGVVMYGVYSKSRSPCERNRVQMSYYTRVHTVWRWVTAVVGKLRRHDEDHRLIKVPV